MEIEIVDYNSKYAQSFYDLNIEWLKTYFYVEPFDEDVLSNHETYIINKGGFIFFILLNSKVVGTAALMPTNDSRVLELTKMAIAPEYRGLKLGQQLMEYCITFAKQKNYHALLLYSSTKLVNAIYIYRKYGFKELPLEKNSPYKRSDIKMKLLL